MKKIVSVIILISLASMAKSQVSNRIISIIDSVNNSYHKILSASYNYEALYIDPARDDSVRHSFGKCWFVKVLEDSIFGAKFHTQLTNHNGQFDYYYDGQKGYEFQHDKSHIIIFDPLKFENNPNNPAKARMSRGPMLDELLDSNFPINLLNKGFDINLVEFDDTYDLIFSSKPNEDFHEIKLIIDKTNYRFLEIKKSFNWIGLKYTDNRAINYISVNSTDIKDSLHLTELNPDYTIEHFNGYKRKANKRSIDLENKVAPNIEGITFLNDPISLNDFKGQYILLDFWEVWCGPCIMAFPKVKELNRKYKDKGLKVIGVISVNKSGAEKIAKKKEVDYTNIVVDKTEHKKYGIWAFPTYVLISPEGNVMKQSEGNLESIINELNTIFK